MKSNLLFYVFYLCPVSFFNNKISDRSSLQFFKCPYSEFFWSAFSRFQSEYVDLQSKSPYSVGIWENKDIKIPEYGHFHTMSCSERLCHIFKKNIHSRLRKRRGNANKFVCCQKDNKKLIGGGFSCPHELFLVRVYFEEYLQTIASDQNNTNNIVLLDVIIKNVFKIH